MANHYIRQGATVKPSGGDYTSLSAAIVGLANDITAADIKVFSISTYSIPTIAAGARSALTNITPVMYSSICIVGVAVVSEANTDWRIKFYKRDTGIAAAYNSDTYIGDVEVASLSATAGAYFEGSVESTLFYWDADMTSEIHVIAENIGQVNTSKLFVNILYTEAD